MPAADISQVQVTFGNGIKREEYGPLKKAEVSIIAIVDQGQDGVAALNYVSKIAQDKVRELLTIGGTGTTSTAAAAESSSTEQAAASAEQVGEPTAAEPARRTRRTKEQMAADNAAAASAAAERPPTADAAQIAVQAPASSQTTSDDEWEAAAPEAVEITDQELNHTCSVTAERTKDALKVKATIALFNPGGDAFDPTKDGGRKFTVNDIPQNQRADFIAKLKALS